MRPVLCPSCDTASNLKYRGPSNPTYAVQYHACGSDSCRNHFKVKLWFAAKKWEVLHQSPTANPRPKYLDKRAKDASTDYGLDRQRLGCPTCGTYGNVTFSTRDDEGHCRRHLCQNCVKPYVTQEYPDGTIKVFQHKMDKRDRWDDGE